MRTTTSYATSVRHALTESVGLAGRTAIEVGSGRTGPGAAGDAVLRIDGLCARYGKAGDFVLKNIDLEVGADDFVAIIGPSGAGKSTLIRCINRLVEPVAGEILLKGTNLTALSQRQLRRHRRRMGMIFQEFNLVERMSVMDNVLSGRLGYVGVARSLFKLFPRADIEAALDILEKVGLGEFVDKRADQLSGGQRQRVGIARALIQDPEILLVDEPTSSLDPKIARHVMTLIRDMSRDLGVPVLCNIHDLQLALEFADRVVGVQGGEKMFEGRASELDRRALHSIYAGEVL